MLRSFLLAPCLLICLACATPFPIESLEEGMTAETVLENFGGPEATNTVLGPAFFTQDAFTYNAESSWTYVDEERNWFGSVLFSVLLPHQVVLTVISAASALFTDQYFQWDWAYVVRKPVVLHFEQGKIASWQVIEPTYSSPPSVGNFGTDPFHTAHGHPFGHGGC